MSQFRYVIPMDRLETNLVMAGEHKVYQIKNDFFFFFFWKSRIYRTYENKNGPLLLKTNATFSCL